MAPQQGDDEHPPPVAIKRICKHPAVTDDAADDEDEGVTPPR
jgi:hypothetical protein